MKKTRQDWDRIFDQYDPAVHGSARQYCESLHLNYHTYCNRLNEKRRREGIRLRTETDWKPWIEMFDSEKESMKSFCRRNGIQYSAFKSARFRAGLSSPMVKKEKIFDDIPGFFILVEVEDDLF